MASSVPLLVLQLKALGVPAPKREYRFHPVRQFRADLAWIDARLLVEVDGGLYVQGGHSRGAGRERDYARDAEAMMLGWRVLRVSPRQVKNGQAAAWVRSVLG